MLTACESQNREKARYIEWGKREPKKLRQEARNGSQKSDTWVASKTFGGGGTAVCENSTRLVALTGKTHLGISG